MNTIQKQFSLLELFRAAGVPGYLLFFQNILLFFVKRKRDLIEYSIIDNSALFQILFVFVVFALCLNQIISSKNYVRFIQRKPNLYILIFSVICLASGIWSSNSYLTIYRSFEMITFLLLIFWTVYKLALRLDFQNIIEWLVFWAVWSIIWGFFTYLKLYGISYTFSEINNVARLEYPAVLFFALLISKRKLFMLIIVSLAIFSLSNKIYLGIVLGSLAMIFGNLKNKLFFILFALITSIFVLFFDLNTVLLETIFVGREAVSIENSSGRNLVWQKSIEAIKNKPFLGYGFVAGENKILFQDFSGAISSHNFLISSLLNTGILGSIFMILYFISYIKISLNNFWPKNKWRVAILGSFIMCLILSLTSPGLGSRVYGSFISVALVLSTINVLSIKSYNNFKKINNENNMGNS
ncbi:O-antigen ligase family protein [Bacteroidota bacterium]|nr:O-antigen ligase family protein [Bacteroidota bacterium]MDC3229726.1 O-antigen ligase family protein [Bacteroidota bacterium]